jgi:hypothetical protein
MYSIKMPSLKKVTVDDLYESIDSFIKSKEASVDDFESMVEVVLDMIKDGYCFTMERDVLRDAMECLTYMYCPDDDMNKDRVIQQLTFDEEDEDEEEDDNMNNDDIMNLMKMMGGMPGMPGMPGQLPTDGGDVVVKKEGGSDDDSDDTDGEQDSTESKQCPVTNEECSDCCENSCKKQESEEVN